jgi:tetratricopeptide (TPR) repeat protein
MDLTALAGLRTNLGELDAARGCLRWALGLAGTPSGRSVLYHNLLKARASLALLIDEGIDELLPLGEAVLERAAPDQAWARALTRSGVACGYARIGRPAEALTHLEQVLPAIEAAPGFANTYPALTYNSAETLWLLACREHAALLERNLREKLLAPDLDPGLSRLALARLCALQGRFDEATEWFTKAREVLAEQGARPHRAIADYDEALMLARRGAPGDRERAAPLRERALAQFRAIGMPGWERRALALLAKG